MAKKNVTSPTIIVQKETEQIKPIQSHQRRQLLAVFKVEPIFTASRYANMVMIILMKKKLYDDIMYCGSPYTIMKGLPSAFPWSTLVLA
jgi:hypothetical protein